MLEQANDQTSFTLVRPVSYLFLNLVIQGMINVFAYLATLGIVVGDVLRVHQRQLIDRFDDRAHSSLLSAISKIKENEHTTITHRITSVEKLVWQPAPFQSPEKKRATVV